MINPKTDNAVADTVRWGTNNTMFEAVNRVVWRVVYNAVYEAVDEAVWGAGAVEWAVHDAALGDSEPPSLQDFL